MASNDWEIIYADMTAEKRAIHKDNLTDELGNLYLSQSQGGKSYQRSITDVRLRLAALIRVERKLGKSDNQVHETVVDFS